MDISGPEEEFVEWKDPEMILLLTLLSIVHFIGLGLAIGAATAKVWLLIKCLYDRTFIPVHTKITPILTRQIVAGLILVTLTGIVWLVLGYDFSPSLIVKIILVGLIWILGPVIDNVFEPRFHKLAPNAGEDATPEFVRAQRQYLLIEIIATLLFYVIIILWMWR